MASDISTKDLEHLLRDHQEMTGREATKEDADLLASELYSAVYGAACLELWTKRELAYFIEDGKPMVCRREKGGS